MGFFKRKREEQQACYDRFECESNVPYYDIKCNCGDAECLEQKQRLAARALRQ